MTKAAIYARRSTDEQGASLDDQEAEGRAYAAERGWSVVAVYRESASGFKPGTPRPARSRACTMQRNRAYRGNADGT